MYLSLAVAYVRPRGLLLLCSGLISTVLSADDHSHTAAAQRGALNRGRCIGIESHQPLLWKQCGTKGGKELEPLWRGTWLHGLNLPLQLFSSSQIWLCIRMITSPAAERVSTDRRAGRVCPIREIYMLHGEHQFKASVTLLKWWMFL